MSATTTIQEPAKPKPPALPIESLNNDTARIYTHIHPILVLSLYAYKFKWIVEDPVPALTESLVWLGALQIAYAAVCLPPTGGSAGAVEKEKRKPGEKKKAGPSKLESGLNGKIIPAFLSLIISILPSTPLLTLILVLFGAPSTTHHLHTVLCAAHISLLTTLPLVYVHGVDGSTWKQIIALERPMDEVYGAYVGTLFGAWVGAVPIPLDWDREWQKWPVTIVTGAYIGFAVGKLVGGTLLKGRKIMFD